MFIGFAGSVSHSPGGKSGSKKVSPLLARTNAYINNTNYTNETPRDLLGLCREQNPTATPSSRTNRHESLLCEL